MFDRGEGKRHKTAPVEDEPKAVLFPGFSRSILVRKNRSNGSFFALNGLKER